MLKTYSINNFNYMLYFCLTFSKDFRNINRFNRRKIGWKWKFRKDDINNCRVHSMCQPGSNYLLCLLQKVKKTLLYHIVNSLSYRNTFNSNKNTVHFLNSLLKFVLNYLQRFKNFTRVKHYFSCLCLVKRHFTPGGKMWYSPWYKNIFLGCYISFILLCTFKGEFSRV